MPLPEIKPVAAHETAPSPVNFDALYQMALSDDPMQRQLASQASQKLTPDEFKQFFDFQKSKQSPHQKLGIDRPDAAQGEMAALLTSPSAVTGMVKGGKAALSALPAEATALAKVAGGGYAMHKMGLPPYLAMALLFGKGIPKLSLGSAGEDLAATEAGAGATAAGSSQSLSAGELTKLKSQGYTPELIDKIQSSLAKTGQAPSYPMPKMPEAPVAAGAPAVERRLMTRTPSATTDQLYQRMREKIASGEPTGTAELRQVGEQKSSLDSARAAASDTKPSILSDVHRKPARGNILRPDQTTHDLASEMAGQSGVKLKALKKIPLPSGDTELARALRQRAHIEEQLKKNALKK